MAVSLLDPTSQAQSQAKFTYAVPSPPVLDATGGGTYTIQANQVDNFFMGLGDSRWRQPVWADDRCGVRRADPCHVGQQSAGRPPAADRPEHHST